MDRGDGRAMGPLPASGAGAAGETSPLLQYAPAHAGSYDGTAPGWPGAAGVGSPVPPELHRCRRAYGPRPLVVASIAIGAGSFAQGCVARQPRRAAQAAAQTRGLSRPVPAFFARRPHARARGAQLRRHRHRLPAHQRLRRLARGRPSQRRARRSPLLPRCRLPAAPPRAAGVRRAPSTAPQGPAHGVWGLRCASRCLCLRRNAPPPRPYCVCRALSARAAPCAAGLLANGLGGGHLLPGRRHRSLRQVRAAAAEPRRLRCRAPYALTCATPAHRLV